MKKLIALVFSCFLLAFCQKPPFSYLPVPVNDQVCRVMFWNPENLFDCFDDSLKLDDEFLPYGIRGWSTQRYQQKIRNTAKVIIAAGAWDPPDIIGLCEVENKNVLFDLVRNSVFSYYNYRFLHHESPDRRGIDVALLYNPQTIEIIMEKPIPVTLKSVSNSITRDILYARISTCADTFSVFISHWPSKYGGAGITTELRQNVSGILAWNVEEVMDSFPGEKIIIMGDFNDTPDSGPVQSLLKYFQHEKDSVSLLNNLAGEYRGPLAGTYKFQGSWEIIDQVIVSRSLVSTERGVCLKDGSFRIFSPDFLLEADDKFGGIKPWRTYSGFSYHGGYSDHLPVILDLYFAE